MMIIIIVIIKPGFFKTDVLAKKTTQSTTQQFKTMKKPFKAFI